MRSILILLLLTFATPALATDGVLEINQTCAVETGCFAGDTAGLPVTISASGSYRLTSNLAVPDGITWAIEVDAEDVGIDLNNFEIRGPVTCSGTPLICNLTSGNGDGVAVTSPNQRGLSVRNGSITGMGGVGVRGGLQSELRNLRIRWNRLNGIETWRASTVSGNTVYENGAYGIDADIGSTLSGNTVYRNGVTGIRAAQGSTILGNTAYQNGVNGITGADGSTLSSNTAYQNGATGIGAGAGSTVSANTAYQNGVNGISGAGLAVIGNVVRSNQGSGISASDGSVVRDNSASFNGVDGINVGSTSLVSDNTAYNNGEHGIDAGPASAVQRNVSRDNAAGALNLDPTATYRENTVGGVVGGLGINMGDNSCNGTTTCP